MKPNPLLRLIPIVLLVIVAYAVGHWRSSSTRPTTENEAAFSPSEEPSTPSVEEPVAPHEPAPPPSQGKTRSVESVVEDLAELAVAAKTMSVPDAHTYAFFEQLTEEELPAVIGFIRGMPPGNEQDVLFVMTTRRWAELDGATAVAQAKRYPALGTRAEAVLSAYTSWARVDGEAAFAVALTESEEGIRAGAITAVIAGAATSDPAAAVELWNAAPKIFRDSTAGQNAALQIASSAYGTGKREEIQTLVDELDDGLLRSNLINSLAREWGGHYPEKVLQWLRQVVPNPEERENIANTMFLSLAQRDPSFAAVWATEYPEETRRREFIAAAVQEWARLDSPGAETWVNEQPSGPYLDGATYAMAVHFMARQEMARSFSWIRRISMGEMREQMLGTLGKMWAATKPKDFQNFLDETSLSPIEVKMLTAKIGPAS